MSLYIQDAWHIHAGLDGWLIRFHGEVVAKAPDFDEARATYNRLRAHAAMALESLRHTLAQEQAR